mgnify:CR=1 FL=1
MEKLDSLNKTAVRKFLFEDVASHYTTYEDFENWAENYKGPFESHLIMIRDYFTKRNNGRSARIYPPLSSYDLEDIFNEIILPKFP